MPVIAISQDYKFKASQSKVSEILLKRKIPNEGQEEWLK
jgi:hypothetical protein